MLMSNAITSQQTRWHNVLASLQSENRGLKNSLLQGGTLWARCLMAYSLSRTNRHKGPANVTRQYKHMHMNAQQSVLALLCVMRKGGIGV